MLTTIICSHPKTRTVTLIVDRSALDTIEVALEIAFLDGFEPQDTKEERMFDQAVDIHTAIKGSKALGMGAQLALELNDTDEDMRPLT